MKKVTKLKIAAAVSAMIIIIVACTTTQRSTFNTIGSIETAATTTVDTYFTLVIQGKVTTNMLPQVTRAYNALQQGVKLALDATQNDTNALAPAALIQESVDLANLVTQAKGQ